MRHSPPCFCRRCSFPVCPCAPCRCTSSACELRVSLAGAFSLLRMAAPGGARRCVSAAATVLLLLTLRMRCIPSRRYCAVHQVGLRSFAAWRSDFHAAVGRPPPITVMLARCAALTHPLPLACRSCVSWQCAAWTGPACSEWLRLAIMRLKNAVHALPALCGCCCLPAHPSRSLWLQHFGCAAGVIQRR